MKNWKHWTFVAGIVVFGIIIGFTSCDNDNGNVEQPEFRENTISLTFGTFVYANDGETYDEVTHTAKVQGTLLNEEWTGVADTIKTTIIDGYNNAGTVAKYHYRELFSRNIIIIVEKTSEYVKYKTIGDGFTMYINFGILNDPETLRSAITNARTAILFPDIGIPME
jgi:hypothetical protein